MKTCKQDHDWTQGYRTSAAMRWVHFFSDVIFYPTTFVCYVGTYGCCDRRDQAACARSFTLWQQTTIEIMCRNHSIIAWSCHIYRGVIFRVHPVRGEPHIQRNAKGDVATRFTGWRKEILKIVLHNILIPTRCAVVLSMHGSDKGHTDTWKNTNTDVGFYLNKMIGLTMRNVTWNRFPTKNLWMIPCFFHLEWSYLNTDMRKFETSQKEESRAQSADSSKAYRKRRAFYCIVTDVGVIEKHTLDSCVKVSWSGNCRNHGRSQEEPFFPNFKGKIARRYKNHQHIFISLRKSLSAFAGKLWFHRGASSFDTKVAIKDLYLITDTVVLMKWTLAAMFPLRCTTAQYHQQPIRAVKSHSRALAAFKNIGKAGKREAIWIKCALCSNFIGFYT